MARGSFLYRVLKLILSPTLRGLYRLRGEGFDDIPKHGPVIIVSNHVSFMDSLWIPVCIRRRMVFLAKAEYFESKKTAWFFRALGMIPVKREEKAQTEAALAAGLEALGGGGVLGLYPEGTRSPDGRLYRGRTGVARLALRSRAPVVPVGLVGSREIMPKQRKFPKLWGSVRCYFGTPLTFERYYDRAEDRFVLRAVTDEIMYEIMSLSGQTYVDEYASREATDVMPEDFRVPVDEMLG